MKWKGVGRRRNVGPCAFCLAPLTFLLNLRFLFFFFFFEGSLFYIGNAFHDAIETQLKKKKLWGGVDEEENEIYDKKKSE